MEMYVHINPSIGKGLCGKCLAWGRGMGNSFFFFHERSVFLRKDCIFVMQHKDGYHSNLPKFRRVKGPGYYLDAPGACTKMLKCPGTAEGQWEERGMEGPRKGGKTCERGRERSLWVRKDIRNVLMQQENEADCKAWHTEPTLCVHTAQNPECRQGCQL